MPKLAQIMMYAGSGALAGATLTYLLARSRSLPVELAEAPGRVRSWWTSRSDGSAAPAEAQSRRRASSIPVTGNQAFDEYRDDALRRLEAESEEFNTFLDRLRKARDKSEFDEFIAQRRTGGTTPQEPRE